MQFKDKIVLVTGWSRWIWSEIVKFFSRQWATVIINYVSNKESAESLLKETWNNWDIFQADVSKQDDVMSLFRFIDEKYKKLDILVNNAGIVKVTPFMELTKDQWDKTHDTNLTSMFLCSQQAVRLMNSENNSIINIASLRGLFDIGRPPIIDYCSSKAASISFTKTLAKELAPKIRVNAVSPWMTKTDIAKSLPKESIEAFEKEIYLERLLDPEEIAKVVIFLASKDASAITGANIIVDGWQSLS